jgi:hypothetical protein
MTRWSSCAGWTRKRETGAIAISRIAALDEGASEAPGLYRQYRPPPFHGRAAILSSAARDATFRDDGYLWNEFLPGREVYRITDTHGEITGAATARALQSIFDAAIAEDRGPALAGADEARDSISTAKDR